MTWTDPAWIITAPRTGSTYLSYLLNRFAYLPLDLTKDPVQDIDIFGEHYHHYFTSRGLNLDGHSPRVTKIHWHWVLRGGLELPDRLIILRRRNHIAQAISLYFSNMTAVSHCSDERSLGEWTSLPVAWDAGEALSCLEQVRNWDRALAELNGLPVYYEDLLRHPLATVSYCYGYMGTAIALADRPMRELLTVPLQRLRTTQKSEFCGKLRALVAD